MASKLPEPRFLLGQTYTSLGVANLGVNVLQYYRRHQSGDWGYVSDKQKQANETALISGGNLLSQFKIETPDGERHSAYVFTEKDRARTVILLTSESWF